MQQGLALQSEVDASGCSEAVTVPMIPLGLKETKELDWSTPLKVGTGLQALRDTALPWDQGGLGGFLVQLSH